MSAQEVVNGLRDLGKAIERLRALLNKQGGRQLDSTSLKEALKDFVQGYFRSVRPHVIRVNLDVSRVDGLMQQLLELASRRGTVAHYKGCTSEIKRELQALSIDAERHLSDVASQAITAHTAVEGRILATLRQLAATTAASYEQVLSDLDSERVSYRGTATELREILRETLDRLAPNAEVEKAPGFQLEKDRQRPTMAQKARFILRQRGIAGNSIDVPKKAIDIVEGTVSSFVRSTYDRGSVDTHTMTGISKPQVMQLKMYVDTVLCELLEIHGKA